MVYFFITFLLMNQLVQVKKSNIMHDGNQKFDYLTFMNFLSYVDFDLLRYLFILTACQN